VHYQSFNGGPFDRAQSIVGVGRSPTLTIIVPCYNEGDVLPETARRLDKLLADLIGSGRTAADSSVCLVDDGSKDSTWPIIKKLRETSGRFGGIKLSRNCGHQTALMTGLLAARGDVLVTVDADLQDDLNAIYEMLDATAGGADVVYGVRRERFHDAMMKRLTARFYYRLLQVLNVEIVFDHADYRLMTRRAVEALRQYQETNLFLRALIPLLGFNTTIVTYDRHERYAGVSKYSVRKMLALAIDGVTSFSTRPLRIATFAGIGLSFFSVALAVWALYTRLVLKTGVPGWASTVIPIYLISGVQLLCIGIMGEYIGKIYLEAKRRPRSHIAATLEPAASQAPERAGSKVVDHGGREASSVRRFKKTMRAT
jgi:polyisoprenyl-phosphate glycosyltransferase